MMYVLIIVSYFAGYVNGPAVTSVEFSSKENCEAASAELTRRKNDWNVGDKIISFCTPK